MAKMCFGKDYSFEFGLLNDTRAQHGHDHTVFNVYRSPTQTSDYEPGDCRLVGM